MSASLQEAGQEQLSLSEARAHVDRVVAASGSSFIAGMRALPKERREAMFAVYAFCREVDDIADEPAPLNEKLEGLQAWRNEVDLIFEGAPRSLTGRALLEPIATFALPKDEFLAIIDGMEMDARGPVVAPDLETLLLYCRRVAGAVGMLSIRCFGASGPKAEELAVVLGEGLQLTNILRDLAEDAEDGRLYLPEEALQAAAIDSRDPTAVIKDPGRAVAAAWLARRARQRLDEAGVIMRALPRRAMRPAILMHAVYARILDRLEARGWEVLEPRVSLSKLSKVAVLLRHGFL